MAYAWRSVSKNTFDFSPNDSETCYHSSYMLNDMA